MYNRINLLSLNFEATRDGVLAAIRNDGSASAEQMLRSLLEQKRAMTTPQVMELLGIPESVYNRVFYDDHMHGRRILKHSSSARWYLKSTCDSQGNDRNLTALQKKARALLLRYLEGLHFKETVEEVMNGYFNGSACEMIFWDWEGVLDKFTISEDEVISLLQEYSASHPKRRTYFTNTYNNEYV